MDFVYDYISVSTFWTILLIGHGLLSVALLGAVTHQAAAAFHRVRRAAPGNAFLDRFSQVRGSGYTGAVCLLWVLTFLLGGWIYAHYRVEIRMPLEQEGFWKTQGAFELKEHLASIGLTLLPFYWYLWQHAQTARYHSARKWTTALLAAMVWYMFLAGHIVNNVRGFGA